MIFCVEVSKSSFVVKHINPSNNVIEELTGKVVCWDDVFLEASNPSHKNAAVVVQAPFPFELREHPAGAKSNIIYDPFTIYKQWKRCPARYHTHEVVTEAAELLLSGAFSIWKPSNATAQKLFNRLAGYRIDETFVNTLMPSASGLRWLTSEDNDYENTRYFCVQSLE